MTRTRRGTAGVREGADGCLVRYIPDMGLADDARRSRVEAESYEDGLRAEKAFSRFRVDQIVAANAREFPDAARELGVALDGLLKRGWRVRLWIKGAEKSVWIRTDGSWKWIGFPPGDYPYTDFIERDIRSRFISRLNASRD